MLLLRPRNLRELVWLSLLLTALVSILSWYSPLPLLPDATWTLFGAKLTFLSILLAAGLWQYQYFYADLTRFFREFAPAWDGWIAFKRSTDERDELVTKAEQAGVKTTEVIAAREQVRRDRERLQAVEENRRAVLVATDQDWNHYQATLSLLFGVGFTILVSLLADLVERTMAPHRAWVALSYGGLVVSLLLFLVLMVYYLLTVSRQLRMIRDAAEKYRAIRFL